MKKQSKEAGFVKLPMALLLDQRISDRAKVLGAVMADLAAEDGALDGVTCEELGDILGCSERTIRRAEDELCTYRYIHIKQTGRASRIWLTAQLRSGNGWSALRWAQRGSEHKEGLA